VGLAHRVQSLSTALSLSTPKVDRRKREQSVSTPTGQALVKDHLCVAAWWPAQRPRTR